LSPAFLLRLLPTQVGINDFKDKKDLINACMASAHVPFFLDFKLARNCRGRQCVDGSFPDFFTGKGLVQSLS
jgi:hypothetical protein